MLARRQLYGTLGTALSLVVLVFLAYLAMGTVNLPLMRVVSELFHGPAADAGGDNLILWQIRIPRALACGAVGAILGIVGATFQSLFRNDLAEPYVIGVSSGAAVGGTIAVLMGWDFGLARVLLAIGGAFGSLLFVMALAKRQGAIKVQSLLVGGVVIGALLSGIVTLNLWLAGLDTGKILWWLLGSTTPMFWDRVAIVVVILVVGGTLLYRQSRVLNAFAVSEFMAERQGVDAVKLKWTVLSISSAMTGVAVGTVGIIGFIGLLAPHISRRIIGNDLRLTLPLSGFIGSALLLAADILAQRLKPGTELPLGAVTAVIGAPLLLGILRKKA